MLFTGAQNNNGQQVFDCVPANGVIPPGSHVDIVVTFAPDHPSDFYSDGVRIDLFGQEDQHVFQVGDFLTNCSDRIKSASHTDGL